MNVRPQAGGDVQRARAGCAQIGDGQRGKGGRHPIPPPVVGDQRNVHVPALLEEQLRERNELRRRVREPVPQNERVLGAAAVEKGARDAKWIDLRVGAFAIRDSPQRGGGVCVCSGGGFGLQRTCASRCEGWSASR